MPDYLLTDPEGQRFKLTAPEFGRNQDFVKEGASGFNTDLGEQEPAFRDWVKENKVPFDPSAMGPQDYDMRGFYRALTEGDPRAASAVDPNDQQIHYPDYWKTPYHETFSNESQWAGPNAPHWNDKDQLVAPNGQVLFDDRPQAGGTEEAAEVAAQRMRQSVRPEGGRKEGAITEWAVGQGEKVKGALEHTLAHPEELPAPGGLGELGAPLGIVARRQAFASPRQIRSHLDELADRVRSGAMTAEEYGRARQRMGLSSDVPDYLRPPEIGARPVNQRTLDELRQHQGPTEDQAREFLRNRLGYVPAGKPFAWARAYQMPGLPSEQQMVSRVPRSIRSSIQSRGNILGNDEDALALYRTHVAQHFPDEKAFTQSYFNGAYNHAITLDTTKTSEFGQGLNFDGPLRTPDGKTFGSIHRMIFPDTRQANHEYLRVDDTARGGGFVKQMTANQIDLYRKMGIEDVNLFANIDSGTGGYSWAKYGWLPSESEWRNTLSWSLAGRLRTIAGQIDPDTRALAELYLKDRDPRAIWWISDMTTAFDPVPARRDPGVNTVGKAILAGSSWWGKLSLSDARQMERFDTYVNTRR